MELNNPAHRLFVLLTKLKTYPSNNDPTLSVLASVFGVKHNPVAVMHAVVEAHNLLREVIQQARSTTSLPSTSLGKYVPVIEEALAFTNFDAPWHVHRGKITAEALVVLEIASHVDGLAQDQDASEEDLKKLQVSLQELFDFVAATPLDPQFKRFILEQVERIRRCLAEYRIAGAQGFVRYLELLIGQTVRNSEIIKRQSEATPEVMSKFKTVLHWVKSFAALTKDGAELVDSLKTIGNAGGGFLTQLSGPAGGEVPEIGVGGDSV